MTSVSSTPPTSAFAPRMRMDKRIEAAVASGTITGADGSAMGQALDSIDQSLASGGGGGTAPASGSVKDRIDALVDGPVTAGTLTGDQATELKTMFAQRGPGASAGAGAGAVSGDTRVEGAHEAHRGGGHHHAHHGEAVGTTGAAGAATGTSAATTPTDATGAVAGTQSAQAGAHAGGHHHHVHAAAATATTDAADPSNPSVDDQIAALSRMLDALRQSLSANGTYGSGTGTAASGTSSASTGMVFDGLA